MIPDRRPRLLVIRLRLPLYSKMTGDWHLCNVLSSLARYYEIHYLAGNWDQATHCGMRGAWAQHLRRRGFAVARLTDAALQRALRCPHLSAVMLCHEGDTATYMATVRDTRPDVSVIYYDLDAYHVAIRMRAERENDPTLLREAECSHRRQKTLVEAADATLLVSPDEARSFREEVPGATVIATPVVVATRDTDARKRVPGTLVFACNMEYRANVDALLAFLKGAYPRILARMPNVTLNIIGADPPQELRAAGADLPGVRFLGYVKDLNAELDRAWISVAPLTWGSGIKGKVVEAMATGLPVVTTSVGVQGLRVRDGEEVLIADDPEAFASAVERLTEDCELHRRLATQARAYVGEHLSPEFLNRQVDALVAFLEQATPKRLPHDLRERLREEREARGSEDGFARNVQYILSQRAAGCGLKALWLLAFDAAWCYPRRAMNDRWVFRKLVRWSVESFLQRGRNHVASADVS